jgi:hypothetical protein
MQWVFFLQCPSLAGCIWSIFFFVNPWLAAIAAIGLVYFLRVHPWLDAMKMR